MVSTKLEKLQRACIRDNYLDHRCSKAVRLLLVPARSRTAGRRAERRRCRPRVEHKIGPKADAARAQRQSARDAEDPGTLCWDPVQSGTPT